MRNYLLRLIRREWRFDLLFIQNIFILLFLLSFVWFALVYFSANSTLLCFCNYSQNFFFGVAGDRNIYFLARI